MDTTQTTDLSAFIVDAVRGKTSQEAIRSVVDKQIDQVINAAVIDAFRSYGDIRKQIEKEVTEALALPDRLDIPSFGQMMMNMLRQKVDANLSDLVNHKLSEEMNEILGIAPKEIKLTEIIASMREHIEVSERYGSSMTCIIEESQYSEGYHHVYLDAEEIRERDKHSCSTRIAVDKDGRIYGLTIDKKDASKTIIMGGVYGWEKQVFAAYCCGSKFIIDDFEPSLSIGDY